MSGKSDVRLERLLYPLVRCLHDCLAAQVESPQRSPGRVGDNRLRLRAVMRIERRGRQRMTRLCRKSSDPTPRKGAE